MGKALDTLRDKFHQELLNTNMLLERVSVKARVLTPKEAIGNPNRKDFPLLKGKERLVQADFKGYLGQAFTDQPGNFEGRLKDVVEMRLNSNYERAIFVAVLNAVMRFLGKVKGTIHCHDEEPELCAGKMVQKIKEKHGDGVRIGIIGYQPALIENFVKAFKQVRATDMDPDNIKEVRYGIEIEDSSEKTAELIAESDVLLCTGTTLVNDSIDEILRLASNKPTYFYGTTIAGASVLLGLKRLCFESK